jgi:hypothetical protein
LLSKIKVSWTGSLGLEPLRGRIDSVSAKRPWFDDLIRRCRCDGRDALPRDPRQDVRWLTSGAAPLIVYEFRRVRRRTSTDAFQMRDAGRAGVQLPSEAATPHLAIGCAAADRAGARPYLRRRPSRSVYYFSGCTLRNKGQAAAISTRLGSSNQFPAFVVVDSSTAPYEAASWTEIAFYSSASAFA